MSQLTDLAGRLKALRTVKSHLEDTTKKVNEEIKHAEEDLVQHMVSEEISNFTHDGNQFYLNPKQHITAKADKRDDLFKWLRGNDLADLIQEQVNAQTLAATVRDIAREGEIPGALAECLNIYEQVGIGLRKA